VQRASPEILSFDEPLVLVGGGDIDAAVLEALAGRGAALVGVDGGADVIAAAGLMPQAIIGDLDSITDAACWPAPVRILRIEEQITTDFEKALYSTRAPLTIAMGMTGRRFDHTLAALHVVTRYAAERKIIIVDGADLALALSGPFAFAVAAGDKVSVHPLLPIRFRDSSGLKYPLAGLDMASGALIGTSNVAESGPFAIEPAESGIPWLLLLDNKYLLPVVDGILAGP
jgi:thiamine pyrophosphokinase